MLAWLKLPGKTQPVLFYLGEKVQEHYVITKITETEIVVSREGHEHTLKIPKPKTAPKVTADKAPKKTPAKPKTSRRTRTSRNRAKK